MPPEHARPRVTVLGSLNVDLVVLAPRLPVPGETVLGGTFTQHMGGKGANQAVAACRAGAEVRMVGAVGADAHGTAALDALRTEGVDVSRVRRDRQAATGVALITVAPDGENLITVAPGANATVTAEDAVAALPDGGVLLASLEVPMAAVTAAVRAASRRGLTVVLNPAPATELPTEVLHAGPVLTPNRDEARRLAGCEDLEEAIARLATRSRLVVTLGPEGAVVVADGRRTPIPPRRVERVVDATGAGDTFSGVLAAWLAGGRPLEEAARAANAAAALSVQQAGARGGMPHRADIERALAEG
ncbi:MAG TPA: ribokinase [candidate division Zixibacteria bacterium]|nr:ribokinase [candidate division Zixibacteria bacterium]